MQPGTAMCFLNFYTLFFRIPLVQNLQQHQLMSNIFFFGGIAALMSVIFAESLGVDSIQDTLGLM